MDYKKIIPVGIFAVSMAFVEAAVVVYIRRIYSIGDLLLDVPPFDPILAPIEVGRELATLIMLLSVGWAVGKSLQARLSFTFFTFGVWDVFYYFWLIIFIGWPDSLLSTDILFLIPLPWWGPVIAPVLIACLMIAGGVFALMAEGRGRKIKFSNTEGASLISGIVIMLYSFMEDALRLLPADANTLSQIRPAGFNWPIYTIGLLLAGYGVMHAVWVHNQNQ